MKELQSALQSRGIAASAYAGHSFRIGAAAAARDLACGIPDSLIKTLGRWESAAYMVYIRIPHSPLSVQWLNNW